jgi:predicted O-methyltransferase YrrM
MFDNKDSWVSIEDLGCEREYKKTYEFEGDYIDEEHKKYSECKTGRMNNEVCIDIGIDGWLQRADALKLYEMAYFAIGDILELGTNKGLSTSIMAKAITDRESLSPNDTNIMKININTVEINQEFYDKAIENFKNIPGKHLIKANLCDANIFMDALIKTERKFGFIFIDHDHDYFHTKEAILRLDKLLLNGGLVLFHDYIDPENITNQGVKVYQAVRDCLVNNKDFEFFGCFGCMALFKYKDYE